jgi:hypothetical protein
VFDGTHRRRGRIASSVQGWKRRGRSPSAQSAVYKTRLFKWSLSTSEKPTGLVVTSPEETNAMKLALQFFIALVAMIPLTAASPAVPSVSPIAGPIFPPIQCLRGESFVCVPPIPVCKGPKGLCECCSTSIFRGVYCKQLCSHAMPSFSVEPPATTTY